MPRTPEDQAEGGEPGAFLLEDGQRAWSRDAGLGRPLEEGLGGQVGGAHRVWGWWLLQGAGAVRANPTSTEPSLPWAAQTSSWEHSPALELSKEQEGHQGSADPKGPGRMRPPHPRIIPGMVQSDQVKLDISPPRVLEAPGAVTDNHEAPFSHLL